MRFTLWFSALCLPLVACVGDTSAPGESFFLGGDDGTYGGPTSRPPGQADDAVSGDLVCDPWGACVPAADSPRGSDAGRRDAGSPPRARDAGIRPPGPCDPYSGFCSNPEAPSDAGPPPPAAPCDPYSGRCDDIGPTAPSDAAAPRERDAAFDPYAVF